MPYTKLPLSLFRRSQMFAASTSVESKELSKEHSALPNELNALLDNDHFKKNALLDITKSVINMNICREKEEKAQLQSETELHLTENDFDSFLSSSSTVFTGFPNTQNYSENSFVSVGGMDQANNLFQIIMKSNELSVTSNSQNMTILGLFCAEGDNRPDGKKLAFTLLSNLKHDVKERSLPNPISWNVLYGAPMSESVMSMFY